MLRVLTPSKLNAPSSARCTKLSSTFIEPESMKAISQDLLMSAITCSSFITCVLHVQAVSVDHADSVVRDDDLAFAVQVASLVVGCCRVDGFLLRQMTELRDLPVVLQ